MGFALTSVVCVCVCVLFDLSWKAVAEFAARRKLLHRCSRTITTTDASPTSVSSQHIPTPDAFLLPHKCLRTRLP